MRLIARLSLLLLFSVPFTSLAEIPTQLKNDFKPISGAIIMPIGDEYLVDLDASTNLKEGDILTLVMAGEKVIHPDTKEVLGTLELAKGYLQVTQVKSGYSYVKLLSAGITPKKGNLVKRFAQTPTRFASSQSASSLEEELKIALPHLTWLSMKEKTKPELIFQLEDNSLKVLNADGVELKQYQYNEGKLSAPTLGTYRTDSFGHETPQEKSLLNQAVANISTAVGFGKKDKRLENLGITQNLQLNKGMWIGSNLDGNPVGLAVGDFDGDGRLETAVALEGHLQILRMENGKMASVASINFAAGVHLLSLETTDIDSNGLPELYLSANVGTKLSSKVVEFTKGSYQNTINRIPWLLRVVDLPQEGRTLIAQTMNNSDNPFSDLPFRVIRSENKLNRGAEMPLPANLNLFNFTLFNGNNDDLLYAHLSAGDNLHVKTPQGAVIWKSEDHFGGSDISFFNKEENQNELPQSFYLQKRMMVLPTGEILVPQNDGSRVFERYRSFKKSRVIALKWDGFTLRQSWSTSEQGGYLADFTLADADNDGQDELVMVVEFQKKNLIQKGRSSIVIYELNQ